MAITPLTLLCGNYLLISLASLISDQVYCFYKFTNFGIALKLPIVDGGGGDLLNLSNNNNNIIIDDDVQSICFLDNFFYGWYYRISTVIYLLMAGIVLVPSVKNEIII